MNSKLKRLACGATTLAIVAAMLGFTGTASAASAQTYQANLSQLNGSGSNGAVTVKLDGNMATVTDNVNSVVKGVPHAQHFHFSSNSAHTCPSSALDKNKDGIVSTLEGVPAYGGVKISLTSSGDTSAKSALAVKRFPSAPNGTINYQRTIKLSDQLAEHIRSGEVAVVVHGIDVNGNGKYDTDAGTSPLAKSAGIGDNFPLEGTAPIACGILSTSQASPTTTTKVINNNANNVAIYIALGLGALGTLLGIVALATASKKQS